MPIEKQRIEAIKHGVDLVALVSSRGIELKQTGQNYLGLCPFLDDTNLSLSINPSKNLWQCFGCGAAGDVIRFVELIDGATFPEAVERLSGKPLNNEVILHPTLFSHFPLHERVKDFYMSGAQCTP